MLVAQIVLHINCERFPGNQLSEVQAHIQKSPCVKTSLDKATVFITVLIFKTKVSTFASLMTPHVFRFYSSFTLL